MTTLLTNRYFLVATGLFLAVAISIIWFFLPPILKQYNDNKTANAQLTAQINAANGDVTTLTNLKANESALTSLHNQASLAVPSSPSAELLLLQLDGLTKSLGLNATITVPFSTSALASQVAAPTPSSGSSSDIKPGSGSTGGSQPVVTTTTGTTTNTDFSISGNFDFPTTLALLTKLKTFARWNKVTGINITKTTALISGQVFWLPESNLQFSGSAKDLITQAQALFNKYQSYTTTPNAAVEGIYGKANPFQP